MKILKKILSLAFISVLLLYSIKNTAYASPDISPENPLKAAVFLNDFNDQFISNVKKNLKISKKKMKIKFNLLFLMEKGIKLFKMKVLIKHLIKILTFLY